MDKLAKMINDHFKSVGILGPRDVKKMYESLKREDAKLDSQLQGLYAIFKAWQIATGHFYEMTPQIESLIKDDIFFEPFVRIQFDRSNHIISASKDGDVYHVFEKDGKLHLKLILD